MREGTIPILTLEVEGMKHSIKTALTEYAAQLSEEIQMAVDAYCMPDNIRRVVADAVKRTIDNALQDELHNFYFYGKGHSIILEAIHQALEPKGEVEEGG